MASDGYLPSPAAQAVNAAKSGTMAGVMTSFERINILCLVTMTQADGKAS
jgi:hypothetical protein